MALIKCPECGKEISDTSKRCVHCGYKLKKLDYKDILVIIAIIILVITIGICIKKTVDSINDLNEANKISNDALDNLTQLDEDASNMVTGKK